LTAGGRELPRTGQPAVRHVAAVERALAVLDVLADGQQELGTNEIARRTGINASTVSRLLATLARAGMVEHVAATGRYRLGLRLLQLGNAVAGRLDLRELARPHLEALARETGETATLSAPGAHDAVTVDFVQGGASVQSVAQIGRPSIGHATATGKVLLAFTESEQPAPPLRAYTAKTITDPDRLAAELARVRKLGYAEAVGEREPDLSAVAAPVLDDRRALVGVLGLQGPASRFGRTERRAAIEALLPRARALSESVGWSET
jgi:IclR family acetate operon transcriptional repressor